MHDPRPPRFKKTFEVNGQEFTFRFDPVNIMRKQLYHVYLLLDGKEVRFHMQKKGDYFEITDPGRIPEKFHQLESELSKAIQES